VLSLSLDFHRGEADLVDVGGPPACGKITGDGRGDLWDGEAFSCRGERVKSEPSFPLPRKKLGDADLVLGEECEFTFCGRTTGDALWDPPEAGRNGDEYRKFFSCTPTEKRLASLIDGVACGAGIGSGLSTWAPFLLFHTGDLARDLAGEGVDLSDLAFCGRFFAGEGLLANDCPFSGLARAGDGLVPNDLPDSLFFTFRGERGEFEIPDTMAPGSCRCVLFRCDV